MKKAAVMAAFSLSKKYFRQTANGSQLKQSSIRSITFTAKMAFQPFS